VIGPEAIVTFDRLDGFDVVESLGPARGEAVTARNFLRTTFRSIGTLIGITPLEYLTDAERARRESLAQLLGNAERMGANGVVGVHFDATELFDGSTHVLAYGEAVILRPEPHACCTELAE